MAVALGLRRRGAEVTLLEQAPEIVEVGAGLQISPNGMVVLQALGVADALAQRSVAAQAVVLRARDGGQVLRLDLARHAMGQTFLCVHRADLVTVLAEAALAAGVDLRCGAAVAEILPGARPQVGLADGTRLGGDLVVGADGVHSRARPVLNGAGQAFFTGQSAWRAVVPNAGLLGPEVQLFMGPGRHLVCYPLRGGQAANIVAVLERPDWVAEGWDHADDPANLRAAFAGFGGVVPDLLARVAQVRLWGLFRHPVARLWQRDGVVLLGDAAHPTLPFMAQGAVMALEDGWVLGRVLDEATELGAALARYQALRRPRVQRVIAAANGNAWKYHLRNPVLRGAAHLGLRLGGRLAPAAMVHQFDWIYRHDVTA